MNLNTIQIAGNLTVDPELRTVGDKQVAKLRIAVNEKWTSKAGEKKEKTTYFDVDAWGNQANACAQYLKKGSGAWVQGKMECQETEKDGQKRKFWSIRADSVQFLGNRADGPNVANQVTANDPPRQMVARAAADVDGELPF